MYKKLDTKVKYLYIRVIFVCYTNVSLIMQFFLAIQRSSIEVAHKKEYGDFKEEMQNEKMKQAVPHC